MRFRTFITPAAGLVAGLLAFPVAAAGIDWTGGVTLVLQHADDARPDAELTGSADLFASLPTANGEWLFYVEASSSPASNGVSAWYPTVNGDARSVLTGDDSGGVQVSEFNYTWRFRDEHSLMLGLIDPSAWLDRGRIANDENRQFLNGSFVNNATIEFPDYTLGGVFRAPGAGNRPEFTVVVSGSDGIADVPDRTYQDLLDFNAEGRGLFLGAGASWLFERLSVRAGGWLRTDDHQFEDGSTGDEGNYGVYGVLGWQAGAGAVNLRVGAANPDVSVADRFLSVAYQRRFAIGMFGIGVAYSRISPNFSVIARENALDSEAYLRIPLFDGAGHITPSLQYVEVPRFDADVAGAGSAAVVAGLRFHWSF